MKIVDLRRETARLAIEGFVAVAELAQAVQRLHHGALHLSHRLLGREAVAVDAAGTLPLDALHTAITACWEQGRCSLRCEGRVAICNSASELLSLQVKMLLLVRVAKSTAVVLQAW